MLWPLRRRHAVDHQEETDADEFVTIEAGPVTLVGPAAEVERVVGVGLYRTTGNPSPMSESEDHVMTGVYVGVGLLLAAGAGYLAWRYLLDDGQKSHVKDALADGKTKAKRLVRDTVRDAKGRLTTTE
jgi:hypothetical protein